MNTNMNTKIKNLLGIVSVAAIIVGMITSLWFMSAFSKTAVSERTFRVSGEGKVVAVPDVAQVSFGITTEGGTDLAKLQKENSGKSNRVIDFLKEERIDEKDIKTQSYNISPRYQRYDCSRSIYSGNEARPCPPSEIVGYTISQRILVKIRDLDASGRIMAGVVDNGANNVSGPNFTIDDSEEIKNKAREEAITKARKKAEGIADAGNFGLGRLVEINENFYGMPRAMSAKVNSFEEVGGVAAPQIEPGSQDVTVTVELVYEIK